MVQPYKRILSSDEKKGALQPQKTWSNLKCMLQNESGQSEKITNYDSNDMTYWIRQKYSDGKKPWA